jgi:hypothetical protein
MHIHFLPLRKKRCISFYNYNSYDFFKYFYLKKYQNNIYFYFLKFIFEQCCASTV